MSNRVPNRYRLTVYPGQASRDFNDRFQAMWAFSAADVVVQFDLENRRFGSMSNASIVNIEPWREEVHGPWPEQLR